MSKTSVPRHEETWRIIGTRELLDFDDDDLDFLSKHAFDYDTINQRLDDYTMEDEEDTEDENELPSPSLPPPLYVTYRTSSYDYICNVRSEKDPIHRLRSYAQSKDLLSFVSASGIKGASFVCNPNALPSRPLFENFRKILLSRSLSSEYIALVFHGTKTENISDISKNGLDPKARKGQAYGAGEYFSKCPSTSASYCKGDKSMLVFCVIIPPPCKENQPPDYVVVEENSHQLPLGTLCYKSVDNDAMSRSSIMKNSLSKLHHQVCQREKMAMQARMKSQIIQYLIQNRIDIAKEKYEKCCLKKDFPEDFSREISMYVHQFLDKSIIDCLFPNLPPPFERKDVDQRCVCIKSVEFHEKKVESARDELNQTQTELINCRKERKRKRKSDDRKKRSRSKRDYSSA